MAFIYIVKYLGSPPYFDSENPVASLLPGQEQYHVLLHKAYGHGSTTYIPY